MKRAVSVSLGSSKRDKAVEVELFGEKISIERIGTDGDMEKAAQLYKKLDGKVDAFGVGGADLGLMVDQKWYLLHSVKPMVRFIEKTPVVDGAGLKLTLERKAAAFLESLIPEYIATQGKTAFIMTGADRWGLTMSFLDAGYECTFGDLMFSLDIPIPLHTEKQLKVLAALLMPIAGRLPFSWIYPTGEKQEERKPKHTKIFQWATVTAGDCHYIKRYMPDDMSGKVIVTNTTTSQDVNLFRQSGVKYLATATPVLDGRSFGTNMMEAALVAVAGKNRPLTHEELNNILDQLDFEPQLQVLINMDAIVTAGGIPKPDDLLYPLTQGGSKALMEIAGKPMIQWVLDALSEAKTIDRIVIVGLDSDSGISSTKPLTYIPNQGSMLNNARSGVNKVAEINPEAEYALMVSSDIPAITAEMVDWSVNSSSETDCDIYYSVIPREVMEKRYPGSKRSFIHLKDMDVCGADMNMIRTSVASDRDEFWNKLLAARKNAFKQAALIGYDTLFLLLLRRLSIDKLIKIVGERLELKGKALISPYAELGMDVDKPFQYEILAAELEGKTAA